MQRINKDDDIRIAYSKLWYHWGVICIKPQILTENGTEFCGPVAASSDLIIASCA